jgi:hypothetical protein
MADGLCHKIPAVPSTWPTSVGPRSAVLGAAFRTSRDFEIIGGQRIQCERIEGTNNTVHQMRTSTVRAKGITEKLDLGA